MRRSRGAALAVAVAAAGLGGCTEGSGGPVAVADSAGVEVVTNLPGSLEAAEAWSLSAEPVVAIGAGPDPEQALYRVSDVAPLEGGRVAVATGTPPRVLVFETDGALAATLGREGEGPGEFAGVGSVAPLPADSLAVWDPVRRRISVFAVEGGYAREMDVSDLAAMSARAAPNDRVPAGFTRLLPSTGGSLVLFAEGIFAPGAGPGVTRVELPAHRIGPAGGELARYGPFPGVETFVGGPAGALPIPFGARTHAAATGDALVVGTAESTEFRVFGPDGALARIVRWPDHDRAVGGEHLSRWSGMVDDAHPAIRDLVEPLPHPERFPAYEGLVATDEGEILAGEYPGPLGIFPLRRADHGPEALAPELRIPARRWLVFASGGALVAAVTTPEGFEPYAVREGLMWGVYSGELDVESVRAYAVSRG